MAPAPRRRKTPKVPDGYDPGAFPSFAVTVDIVILTLLRKQLHVLLVQRSEDPFEGEWALPGGFKRPDESLDEAAVRELAEETRVTAPPYLAQFGAYGDPGRDPRTNVVTIAYLAVLRDPGRVVPGGDAAEASFVPVDEILSDELPLAFDHAQIVRDAVDRVRTDLETTGLATAFVGESFTLSELRHVFEAAWDIELDPANFQRTLTSRDQGWVEVSDEPLSTPSPKGGRPSKRFTATTTWQQGSPVRRPRRD